MTRGISNRTPKKRAAFLKALEHGASVTAAAKTADISRASVYEWREAEESFRVAWEEAIETGTDALEDAAMRRALSGQSDAMITFLLKARRREKYRNRGSGRTGPETVPIDDLARMTEEQLLADIARLDEQLGTRPPGLAEGTPPEVEATGGPEAAKEHPRQPL